jgi:hypothetical protein|tara:strand:- start:1816 stop:2229 length:414 start_codon:yes stop_codon:yes gene_type:complete
MKVKLTETELVKLIEKVLLEKKEKECPEGMYWCRKSKACKPKSEKREDMGETIGFTNTYSGEIQSDLKAFIEVVSGHIKDQVNKKSLHGEDALVQRMYQLLAEGGELHTLVQELIDILDSLPDKEQRPIGFRIGGDK